MVEWVMCMNLILSAVLLKEHTRWQQALVSEFPDPRPVVIRSIQAQRKPAKVKLTAEGG